MKDDDHHLAESGIEALESEELDLDATPPNYEIVTYPADYTLEGLVPKVQRGQITIPGFQRKFVWTLPQASKLIESFLLGLPVPAIFLYTENGDALIFHLMRTRPYGGRARFKRSLFD